MSVSEPRVERIDALTGLRIFPALAVVLSHLPPPAGASNITRSFLAGGYCGVTIFFVLSGYVLAHNYFDRMRAEPSARLIWSYVAARLARVYPLYLLLLIWVSLPLLYAGHARSPVWWNHALALQAWSPTLSEVYAYNAPGWSISVEFFLYACFPLLVFLLAPFSRRGIRGILIGLALVIAIMGLVTAWFFLQGYDRLPANDPWSAHRWLYRNPLCRLGDFALGILTARLAMALRAGGRSWSALGNAAVGIGVAAIVMLMGWPAHSQSASSWDFSYAVPAALVMLGLALTPGSLVSRALGTRPLLLLGEASYALYLCHGWVLQRFKVIAPAGNWLVIQSLTIFMVIAVAIGLHVGFERPTRWMLRSLLDPRSRPVAAVSAADPKR